MNIIFTAPEELKEIVNRAVKEAMKEILPKVIRQASKTPTHNHEIHHF